MESRFAASLREAVVEKDVENAYRGFLLEAIPGATITSPCRVDGYLKYTHKGQACRVLLETKRDLNMGQKKVQMRVLSQCLLYMKAFRQNNIELPTHILVGDKDQFFVLDALYFYGYLHAANVEWDAPASKGSPALAEMLTQDHDLFEVLAPTEQNLLNSLLS